MGGTGDAPVVPEPVPSFVPIPAAPPASAGKPDADSPAKRPQPAAKKKDSPPPDRRESPAPDQSATVSLPSGAPNRTSEVPNFSVPPATFEPDVAKAPTVNPFADAGAAAGLGGWVPLPNAASRQAVADEASGRGGNADLGAGDFVEPVPHVVRSGENFWTIARLYYGSGRFYKALWKANSEQVPAPEKLRVGQTIRIPPPESLERSLILPPRTTPAPDATSSTPVHRTSRPVLDDARSGNAAARPSEVELALPVADPFHGDERPDRRTAGDLVPARGASDRRRAPVYRVRPHETLRSIARDTLGDSRRAGELLELNRDVIDDPNHPTPGQVIDLPADARLARRAR
jgi:nucleoid-associated protein YgaU